MRQPRKPTLAEKKIMAGAGLDWKEWNVKAGITNSLLLINKRTGERKVVPK